MSRFLIAALSPRIPSLRNLSFHTRYACPSLFLVFAHGLLLSCSPCVFLPNHNCNAQQNGDPTKTLENVSGAELAAVPKFRITGKLHRTVCQVHLPFTGEIVVEASEAPVKSIHLLLVRVETVRGEANEASEATEIQDIQIADGDVCRNMVLPLYAILPRLFTCPTVSRRNSK